MARIARTFEPLAEREGLTLRVETEAEGPPEAAGQEAAEQDLLGRLVALNQDRAAEEARGHVRWLRPEFQRPKLAHKVPEPAEAETPETELALVAEESRPKWPSDGLAQIRVVQDVLRAA